MEDAMPDALTLLETRRSVSARNMVGPGPDDEALKRMIAVAIRVPDHGKLAPWRFVVYAGAARAAVCGKLADLQASRGVEPEKVEATRTAFARAPVVVGVISTAQTHPKIPLWEQELSAGAATMNLCHAAHAMGFVANWLTDWFAFDDAAKAILGVTAAEKVAGFVYIGSMGEPPQERPRPAVDDITRWWTG
jgi:nitroreductase